MNTIQLFFQNLVGHASDASTDLAMGVNPLTHSLAQTKHSPFVKFDDAGGTDNIKAGLSMAEQQAIDVLKILLPVLAGLVALWCAVWIGFKAYKAITAPDSDTKKEYIKDILWTLLWFFIAAAVGVIGGMLQKIVDAVQGSK